MRKLLLLFVTSFVYSATILVPEDYSTIQGGINASSNGDTVFVSSGTYNENILFYGKEILLLGEDRENTVIDGGYNGTVVNFQYNENYNSIIEGFTIMHGSGNDGAIKCAASPILRNLIIKDSVTNGITIYQNPIISNVIIKNNIGSGCFINSTNASPILERVLIHDNQSSNGAGLFLFQGEVNIINSTIVNNVSPDCSVNDEMIPCPGGGIKNWNGSVTTSNSIIRSNYPDDIYFFQSGSLNASYSNIDIVSQGDESGNYNNEYQWDGADIQNINENSQFTDPENGDFTLLPSSPCIDVGDPNSELDPDGTIADMGAYAFDQRDYGCMDSEACNYDPEAIYDDGSCIYSDNCDEGCTNPDAVNYDEDAVFDDGSCVVPDIIVPDDESTIQNALSNATAGQTIFVRAGTYYESNIIWPNIYGLKLIGESKNNTIIDANSSGRIFHYYSGCTATIDGSTLISNFTLQNGFINGSGSCMHFHMGVPSLDNLIIKDNVSSWGNRGAINFYGNAYQSGNAIFSDVYFINNYGYSGAAITVTTSGCAGTGDANGDLYIVNSIFEDGYGHYGTGLYLSDADKIFNNIIIDKCYFVNNIAESYAPAIYIAGSNPIGNDIISDCIFYNNQSQQYGSTVRSDSQNRTFIINSINIDENTYPRFDVTAIINSAVSDYLYEETICTNCIDSDPGLTYLGNGEFSLQEESPCIDSGVDIVDYNGEVVFEITPDEYEGFAPDIGPWETSQMFVPDPIITNIEDIDNDQGGRVFLDFQRSFHDKDGFANRVEVYTVERMSNEEWVGVLTQSAYNDSTYRVEVTTLIDSSSTSDGLTDFRVIANMEEGNFLSETSTGYSVDNIHPSVPEELFASSSEQDVNLSWNYSEDIDFAHHMVSDIDDNPAYTIDNDISIPLNTSYNEYHVNSMDINGNMSDNSEYASAYDLSQGANLISFSILPEDRSVGNVIQSDDITAIIGEGVAASYNPVLGWVGSLSEISPTQGYWVASSNGEILNTVGQRIVNTEYDLHPGANLISYTCDQSAPIGDIIQDIEITSVIGEGVATTYNPVLGWVGSLSSLEPGSGYWFKADSDVDFSFDCPDSETFSREYVEAPIKDYIQSTEQAFYFFGNIPEAEEGDVIRAYNGDILVGSRVWNGSYTDVPAMGKDFQSETQGFLSDSDVPTFKLIKKSGEELALEADIPGWSSNGIFIIENASSSQIIPDNFGLASAYPNPFNPTTTIGFQVPYSSNVILEIYDITGRKIRQLANNYYTPGYHSVVWDASDVSSGVYFVKMNADGFNASQKLMLIK